MRTLAALVHLLSTAGVAGGCSCLSVILAGLIAQPPHDASRIMRLLLPRMGAIMAPLLVVALSSGALSAWLASRTRAEELGSTFAFSTAAFGAIALVTVLVHLPINGALLALAALCVLAWSRRYAFAPA